MAFTVTERQAWVGSTTSATTLATSAFAATGGGVLLFMGACGSESSINFANGTASGHGGSWSTLGGHSFQSATPSTNAFLAENSTYTTGSAAVTATWGTSSEVRGVYCVELTAGAAITRSSFEAFEGTTAGVLHAMAAGAGGFAIQFINSWTGTFTTAALTHFAGNEIEDANHDGITNCHVAHCSGLLATPSLGGLLSGTPNWYAAMGVVYYEGSAPTAPARTAAVGARTTSGTTAPVLSDPNASAARDGTLLDLMSRVIKPSTATATDTSDFAELLDVTGGTGSQGTDTGPSRLHVEQRSLGTGDTGNVTTAVGNSPNAVTGNRLFVSRTDDSFDLVATSGDDASHGTGRSATGDASLALAPGDLVYAICASDTDATTVFTAASITASGITFGVTQERLPAGGAATGQDIGHMLYEAIVSSGSGSAAPVLSLTGGPSQCGRVGFVRVRSVSSVNTVTGTAAGTGGGSGTVTGLRGVFGVCVGTGGGTGTVAGLRGVLATAAGAGGGTGHADGTVIDGTNTVTGTAIGAGGGTGTSSGLRGVLATVAGTGGGAGTVVGLRGVLATASRSGGGTGTAAGTVVTSVYSDDFNRANNDDLGAPWLEAQGEFAISSNGVIKSDGATPPGFLVWDIPLGQDHWVEATLALSNGSGNIGLFVRLSEDGLTGWSWEVADGQYILIDAIDGEAGGTEETGASHDHATGETYRVECDGNDMTFYRNGVEVLNHTSSTYNNSDHQRVGLHWHENSAGAVRWDNFRAGPMPYVAPPANSGAGAGGGTGSVTGLRGVLAVGAGTGGGSGTAASDRGVLGTAIGSGGGAGTATGLRQVNATGTGSGGGTATATGLRGVFGIASGSGGGTGAAAGSSPGIVTGTAVGQGGGTGTSSGLRGVLAISTNAAGGLGSGSGVCGHVGAAVGAGGGTGGATGRRRVRGTCTGMGGGTGTALVKRRVAGVCVGLGGGHGHAQVDEPMPRIGGRLTSFGGRRLAAVGSRVLTSENT